ncbi:hypothetical protein FMM08_14320 [Quadrisphaera setariae]|uniref:NERD domain-containing protein n=1 Tax=Quadrisphaera setariae TaxID=2593304 RepID=A0A5C8ZDC3_9ACTN|nr:hypothetical protein FMM08_14320 [Quadrisphaera setariae]
MTRLSIMGGCADAPGVVTPGSRAAQRVAAALEELRAHGWELLHGVHRPGRPRATLDHVAVGPGGVVVVDAVRSPGTPHEREDAARMACDVASLLPPRHRTAVVSVLCAVGQPLAVSPGGAGVAVVSDAHLAEHLRSLPHRFDDDDVRAVAAQLRELLAGPHSPSVLSAQAWEQRTAPVSVPSLAVLGTAAAPPGTSGTPASQRSTHATAARAGSVQERRVRRRPAPSRVEHLLTRLGLLGLLVGGCALWVHALG